MIKVLKSGMDKKYFAKCGKCATEFEYEHSDVKYEKNIGYNSEVKTITCPVCGQKSTVELLTKDEYDLMMRTGKTIYSCCVS